MAHQCQAMTHFELWCVKILALQLQIEVKTQIVSSHDTISVAVKQLHIMPMGPRIDGMVSHEVLMAHQCQAMTHFELWCVKILVLALQLQIGVKTQIISSHDTISVAAKQIHIMLMGPMIAMLWCPMRF
jgi:transcriptional antiterminator Rof (Rho-off)